MAVAHQALETFTSSEPRSLDSLSRADDSGRNASVNRNNRLKQGHTEIAPAMGLAAPVGF